MGEKRDGCLMPGSSGGFSWGLGKHSHPTAVPTATPTNTPSATPTAVGALEGNDLFIGTKVEEHRGALRIDYPIEHGIIQNWSDMEKVWSHLYSEDHLLQSTSSSLPFF